MNKSNFNLCNCGNFKYHLKDKCPQCNVIDEMINNSKTYIPKKEFDRITDNFKKRMKLKNND